MLRIALLFSITLATGVTLAADVQRVVTAQPERLDSQQTLSLTGSVVSLQQAQVSARADGLIEEILVDTGAMVTQGQALLRLDADLAELDK